MLMLPLLAAMLTVQAKEPCPQLGDAPAAWVGITLATVDGHPVGSAAVDTILDSKTPAEGGWTDTQKREAVQRAIDDEVLFQEAICRGLQHDPKVRKVLISLLLRQEVYDTIRNEDFPEAEMRRYFDTHREDFNIPEKIQIKRIFIKVTPERDEAAGRQLAAELARSVRADPAAFSNLALAHSEDAFARRGGDLGYVSRDGRPDVQSAVIDRAFTLDVGEVTDPFLAGGGWNIVTVTARREAIQRDFEQMKGSVLRRLKEMVFQQRTAQLLERLRADVHISVDEAAVRDHAPQPGRAGPDLSEPSDEPEP